jgi:ribosomal protein L24E
MRLLCMCCKESFSPGDFFELLYSDDGIYFFCSEECRNKWVFPVTSEKECAPEELTPA